MLLIKGETAMKHALVLKNVTHAMMVAAIFGMAGTVQAQNKAGQGDGSASGQGTSATAKSSSGGKTGPAGQRKKQDSSNADPGNYTYGKDAASDYARAQGAGPSGSSYTYGKDAASDYAVSQGPGL